MKNVCLAAVGRLGVMAEQLAKYFGKIRGGMSEIIPGLHVGCLRDANDSAQLKQRGITHVLSLQSPNAPNTCAATCEQLRLQHLTVTMSDSINTDLTASQPDCNDFIQTARALTDGECLVHCFLGSSRSVAVVCAYLMTLSGWPADRVLQLIERKRPTANPNFGFRMQLKKWETKGNDESLRFHRKNGELISLGLDLRAMEQALNWLRPAQTRLSVVEQNGVLPADDDETEELQTELHMLHSLDQLQIGPRPSQPLPPSHRVAVPLASIDDIEFADDD